MGKISCLHISDVHIGDDYSNSIEDFYSTICRDLKCHNQKVDLIVCTGDLAQGKSAKNAGLAKKIAAFFSNLLARINKEHLYASKELDWQDVLFVPGNHDVQRDTSDRYHFYDQFLNEFYGRNKNNLYSPDNTFYYVTKIYEEEKIAFIGLNSCKGECRLSRQDREWVDNLDFEAFDLESDKEEKIIEYLKKSKNSYDDYGEISTEQYLKAFDYLRDQIGDTSAYKIVCFFHHHIYPFPEIYDKYGDSSMVRNFSSVLNTLIDNNVKIVLHGHKHTPISRFITTNKYFEDPKKSLYIFSTGTLANNGDRGFEVVEIHSPNQLIEAEVHKYAYSGEELQNCIDITVPPQKQDIRESNEFHDILRLYDLSLDNWFKQEIEERDNVSSKYQIDKIISCIEKTILHFNGITQDLRQNPKIIAMILFAIRMRVILMESANKKEYHEKLINLLKENISQKLFSETPLLLEILFGLLRKDRSKAFNFELKKIFKNINTINHKKEISYVAIACFFTDLYLSIGYYGDEVFKKEGINHKINIKLEEGSFSLNVPNNSIRITGDEDRRAAFIEFKSKDPTAHKVGVLIVKEFEEKITQIEDAFKELNLKIYYVRPVIKKEGYQMDNYNFEAYIPTLLPLLTGDNLYAQKEVFIRELIQNSYDAIRLRKTFDKSDFDTTICIKIGRDENNRRYLQIKDNGVGMDLYKIERYFTSIGRSFYQSEDFKELQKEKGIQYKALSNFGIGFLSVFMVCKEVFVRTKSINMEKGINIHIPNYEGCFFIKEDSDINFIGTEIRIYEDDRKLIDTKRIKKYIEDNFIDFEYDIKVEHSGRAALYRAHNYRYALSPYTLFIPLEDYKESQYELKNYPIKDLISKEIILKSEFGISIDIKHGIKENEITYLNAGIKVNESAEDIVNIPFNYKIVENFPSSLVQLNVSRDKIMSLKTTLDSKKIDSIFVAQAFELAKFILENEQSTKTIWINSILYFAFSLSLSKKEDLWNESFSLIVWKKSDNFSFDLIPLKYKPEKEKYAITLDFDGGINYGGQYKEFINKTVKEKVAQKELLLLEEKGKIGKLSGMKEFYARRRSHLFSKENNYYDEFVGRINIGVGLLRYAEGHKPLHQVKFEEIKMGDRIISKVEQIDGRINRFYRLINLIYSTLLQKQSVLDVNKIE